jgi:membrane-associated protein
MSPDQIQALILDYRYWILIPLTFIEGPIIGFITGALSSIGYFNPILAFMIFIFRDIIMDGLYYFLGKHFEGTPLSNKMLAVLKVTPDHLDSVRKLWDTRGLRTMFLGKLSYGVAHAFLFVAGMVKMPFARFFRYALIVALVNYGGLFLFGYFLGGAFGSATNVISDVLVGIGLLTLAISGYYIFSFYLRRRLIEEEKKAGVINENI